MVMESNSGSSLKAQVLYYLCRNGKMEPPHMIQVPHLANEGLRLIDVKHKLTVLRGSAMSNMFSWSYKRIYKNKYIWLDLSDEDVIVPGSGGEYVLKGSEYFDDCQDKMMKHVSSQESDVRKTPEVLRNKFRGAEGWLKQDTSKSISDHCPPIFLKTELAEKPSKLPHGRDNAAKTAGEKKLFPIDNAPAVSRREKHGFTSPDECIGDNKISSSSDLSDSSTQTMNDIKMLHTKSPVAAPARHCCDAATQTDLDNEGSGKQENQFNSRISKHCNVFTKEYQEQKSNLAEASLLSIISGEDVPDKRSISKKLHCEADTSSQSRDKNLKANVRLKHNSASRVFLQILSCGGLDGKVQKNTSNSDSKSSNLEKIDNREQSSCQLKGLSQPSSRVGSKAVTPRGHRSPESFNSRSGTPITYSCELELDNGNNLDIFNHSIPPCSGVEEVVTALPFPSNEDLSKLASRCSSFSSRRSSRSTDFDSQHDKKIKEVGTAFGTPCKTPGGSPVGSGIYRSANVSRVVSPARLPSSEGDRVENWACNFGERLLCPHIAGNMPNPAGPIQILEQKSKWKDLSPIKRDMRLSKVGERC